MLSNNVAALLAPYKQLINKNALSLTYRSLLITSDKVIGCSAAVILETKCALGLQEDICVDAVSFLAIVDSLSEGQEVKLDLVDKVLIWSCGSARGKLATVAINDMPSITRRTKLGGWTPTAVFVEGLTLGGLSCGSSGLASVGMYGVVIDNRGPLVIHSSDNTTVSACFVQDGPIAAPDLVTITPEPAKLLAEIIMAGEGQIEFDETSIFYTDKYCRCLIKQVPQLKYDALQMVKAYDTDAYVAPIPADAISSFIKRANALAESAKHTYIALEASDGKLALAFQEGVSQSDEWYLVKDLKLPPMPAVPIDAGKLARAMGHVNEVCLDHLERSVVVMRGSDPKFRYLISGRAAEATP